MLLAGAKKMERKCEKLMKVIGDSDGGDADAGAPPIVMRALLARQQTEELQDMALRGNLIFGRRWCRTPSDDAQAHLAALARGVCTYLWALLY